MASILENCDGFDWDEGNSNKNWHRHRVTDRECEEMFANLPLIVALDVGHSEKEERHTVLGRTDKERWLFAAITIRTSKIRLITCRDMNKREERQYEEEEIKRNSKL